MPDTKFPVRAGPNHNGISPLAQFILGLAKILRIISIILSWIGRPLYLIITLLVLNIYYLILFITNKYVRLMQLISKSYVFVKYKTYSYLSSTTRIYRSFFHFLRYRVLKVILFRLGLPINIFKSLRLLQIKTFVTKALLICFFIGMLVLIQFYLFKDLPSASDLTNRNQALSTRIYDRNGILLYKLYKEKNRTLLKLEEIPLYTRQATIAIEDADFYSHTGFSLRGITRAIVRNIMRGETIGGSTITQQLVKNALLSPEKTFSRKAKELILAIQAELHYPKDKILEMYLNEIAFGGATYGIEEASQTYFDKSARDLTLAESALLAGLPKAPTTYSPFGANTTLAKTRQYEVLSRMVQQGFITQLQAEEAINQQLVYKPQGTDIKAPHFVMYIKQLLAEKYGEQIAEQGGLQVVTSLDINIQEMAEDVVSSQVAKISKLGISNGAAMVTNPSSGEILAMVGSKDYFDGVSDGNFNVTTALRQPGSSIKPLNYAYAIESKKYTSATLIPDTPIVYQTKGSEPYAPRNYDNKFRGNVTLRTSLASSLNIPAVKVLASYGVEKMIEQGTRMGITTWTSPERYGLSLTLGGGEIKMADMAVLYGSFANYGKTVNLMPILSITNSKGTVLETNNCINKKAGIVAFFQFDTYASEAPTTSPCSHQSLDERVAFIITDILRDNNARTPVFGSHSLLNIPKHPEVAVKTGTTQNMRDNWAIGYTKDYTVAAWVGNNDNSPMKHVASGVTGATPIWHEIMKNLLQNKETQEWQIPAGVSTLQICPTNGALPCEGCGGKIEYFLSGTEPTAHCITKPVEENNQDVVVHNNSSPTTED